MIDVDALADAIAERLRRETDDRPLLTTKDLAVRLGVSERQAREMVRSVNGNPPKIPSMIVGDGARRIRPADVDAYLSEQEGER